MPSYRHSSPLIHEGKGVDLDLKLPPCLLISVGMDPSCLCWRIGKLIAPSKGHTRHLEQIERNIGISKTLIITLELRSYRRKRYTKGQ